MLAATSIHSLRCMQALSPYKPYPAGAGGSGIALASDGSVALLSGSPAGSTQPANAFLYSFYNSVNQYNACPQQITVRPLACSLLLECPATAFFRRPFRTLPWKPLQMRKLLCMQAGADLRSPQSLSL